MAGIKGKSAIRAQVSGVDDIIAVIMRFQKGSVRSRIMRKALDKVSQPLLTTVRQTTPKSDPKKDAHLISGLMRKSMGRRVRTYRNSGIVVVIVGPRSGFKGRGGVVTHPFRRQIRPTARGPKAGKERFQNPVRYAHLVEGGHGGPRPARPHHWMKPAWTSHRQRIETDLPGLLWQRVIEEVFGKNP